MPIDGKQITSLSWSSWGTELGVTGLGNALSIIDISDKGTLTETVGTPAQIIEAAWRLEESSWNLIRLDQIDNGPIFTVDWNLDGTSYLTVSRNSGLQIWHLNQTAV
jgi:WD40 repeat protein